MIEIQNSKLGGADDGVSVIRALDFELISALTRSVSDWSLRFHGVVLRISDFRARGNDE
jgi:hypothetical protein